MMFGLKSVISFNLSHLWIVTELIGSCGVGDVMSQNCYICQACTLVGNWLSIKMLLPLVTVNIIAIHWVSPSVCCNSYFPDGSGLAGTKTSSFWILLELRMMESFSFSLHYTQRPDDVDNWSYKTCKAPVKSSLPSNQHPVFYRPDALPVAQHFWALKAKLPVTWHHFVNINELTLFPELIVVATEFNCIATNHCD